MLQIERLKQTNLRQSDHRAWLSEQMLGTESDGQRHSHPCQYWLQCMHYILQQPMKASCCYCCYARH